MQMIIVFTLKVRVIASMDNTDMYINDEYIMMGSSGSSVARTFSIDQYTSVKANKPVLVTQWVYTAFGNQFDRPSMVQIPPLEQWKQVGFIMLVLTFDPL